MSDASKTTACCHEFSKATQRGTDNEGYGRLIMDWDGVLMIGAGLAPMKFCPWCSTHVKEPSHAE